MPIVRAPHDVSRPEKLATFAPLRHAAILAGIGLLAGIGRRYADLAAELGQAYSDFWLKPDVIRAPGGESFVDRMGRVEGTLLGIGPGYNVLIVHSGTIRAILALALRHRSDLALQFVVEPLSVTRVDQIGAQWRIG